jgi:Uri superfamily endonuclease
MKWYIDYLDSEGDLNHIWVEALCKEEAEQVALSEYWNIDTIIDIHK